MGRGLAIGGGDPARSDCLGMPVVIEAVKPGPVERIWAAERLRPGIGVRATRGVDDGTGCMIIGAVAGEQGGVAVDASLFGVRVPKAFPRIAALLKVASSCESPIGELTSIFTALVGLSGVAGTGESAPDSIGVCIPMLGGVNVFTGGDRTGVDIMRGPGGERAPSLDGATKERTLLESFRAPGARAAALVESCEAVADSLQTKLESPSTEVVEVASFASSVSFVATSTTSYDASCCSLLPKYWSSGASLSCLLGDLCDEQLSERILGGGDAKAELAGQGLLRIPMIRDMSLESRS